MMPALLTSTSILPASASTPLTPAPTDASSLTSNSTVMRPSFRRASAAFSVLALRTTPRGVHSVASAEQRFRRVTAKAAASAGDQDCFGHTLKGFHTVLLLCCDTSVRGCDLTMLPPLLPCRVERRRAAATVQSIVPTTLTAQAA